MKILHVTKKYPNAIGGDSTCVFNLEKEQIKNGHAVFVLTTNCREIVDKENLYKFGLVDNSFNWDKVTVKRILSLFMFIFASLSILKKIKPDIIHSHSADLGFIIAVWAIILKTPVINTCHTLIFPHIFINKAKRCSEWLALKFGFFDRIITVDPKSVEYFSKYGIKNCVYLPMVGVDIEAFDKVKRNTFQDKKDNKTKFLFVGRLDVLKGLDYLFQALSKLKQYTEDFEVWIVGTGQYKISLQRLSEELSIIEKVRFFGAIYSREKLMEIYCRADIFVLPSLLECFPVVILEAWAAGLAVIATDVGGVKKISKDRDNVLIVSPGEANPLFLAMLSLINDKDLRKKISFNGRQLAEEKYGWQIVSKNLEFNYKDLIN